MSEKVFYHATTADRVLSIVEAGILPSSENGSWKDSLVDWSQGKAFASTSFGTAHFYGRQIWTRHHYNTFKALLRFTYDSDCLIQDPESPEDYFSTASIVVSFEIFVPVEGVDLGEQVDCSLVEKLGRWEPLSIELATAISNGDWDGEIIEEDEVA